MPKINLKRSDTGVRVFKPILAVDTPDDAYSSLDLLADVKITSASNNNLLIYDATALQWENHTISGTSAEIVVTFSDQNITLSLANNIVFDGGSY